MANDSNLVKIHFDLSESEMGVGGESLWAALVGPNLYELRNSPWHVRTVNWLDVVEATRDADNELPEFTKVHKRSGHRTIHVYVFDAGQNSKQEILDTCNRLGATYEGMNGNMYALDFGPEIEIDPAVEYLEELQERELTTWRLNEYE